MIKYKKKNGFPFDIDVTLKEVDSDWYFREVVMLNLDTTSTLLMEFGGGFDKVTSEAKQYVQGLFDGYKLGRKE